ncbi:MAG: RNA polymerase sigma factor [bacterium]
MNTLDQLAVKAKSGDAGAFGRLFDELSPSIYRFLAFRLNRCEDAQDLTNQTFLEAWQSIRRYDESRSFKTWLFAIARYILIDFYRRQRPKVSLEAVTERPADTDLQADIELTANVGEAIAAINQLPELYQTTLKLRYIEELEYAEIAQITGKTENSIRVIVKRGLDKLRNSLTPNP